MSDTEIRKHFEECIRQCGLAIPSADANEGYVCSLNEFDLWHIMLQSESTEKEYISVSLSVDSECKTFTLRKEHNIPYSGSIWYGGYLKTTEDELKSLTEKLHQLLTEKNVVLNMLPYYEEIQYTMCSLEFTEQKVIFYFHLDFEDSDGHVTLTRKTWDIEIDGVRYARVD